MLIDIIMVWLLRYIGAPTWTLIVLAVDMTLRCVNILSGIEIEKVGRDV